MIISECLFTLFLMINPAHLLRDAFIFHRVSDGMTLLAKSGGYATWLFRMVENGKKSSVCAHLISMLKCHRTLFSVGPTFFIIISIQ